MSRCKSDRVAKARRRRKYEGAVEKMARKNRDEAAYLGGRSYALDARSALLDQKEARINATIDGVIHERIRTTFLDLAMGDKKIEARYSQPPSYVYFWNVCREIAMKAGQIPAQPDPPDLQRLEQFEIRMYQVLSRMQLQDSVAVVIHDITRELATSIARCIVARMYHDGYLMYKNIKGESDAVNNGL